MALAIQQDPATYQDISYDDLITYVVNRLEATQRETTFENIVAEAFTLFPKRFSLRGYPQWPDSAVINKSWLRCRTDKHFIQGSVKEGFHLTPKGLNVATHIEKQLGAPKSTNHKADVSTEIRTKAGRLLRALEKSKAFTHFKQTSSLDRLKDYDLTDMLLCMPDSETKVIKHNLEQFIQAAELYKREDIKELLSQVKSRLLTTHPSPER